MPPKAFPDVPDGSWFISAKVEDDATWEKVKSGEVKGFSVEGIFRQVPVRMSEDLSIEHYANMVKDGFEKLIELMKAKG